MEMLWSHVYSGVVHFVATDCNLGEKVVICKAGELLGEGGSLLQEGSVFNGVLSGSRGRGAGGRCRKRQHEV